MATYQVSGSGSEAPGIEPFEVQADRIEEAAELAVRRLYGRSVVAHRVTGDPGKSGVWQGYERIAGGGLTSKGAQLHIM